MHKTSSSTSSHQSSHDNDIRTKEIHITKAEKEKNHNYLILCQREQRVCSIRNGNVRWMGQVIFELTAERDNTPYHIAANMIPRRLQAHLMNCIGADLQQGTIRKQQYLV